MSRTAVVVQARVGSTRLPGKVLQALRGKTVLAHALARCAAIPGIDSVVCATSDLPADDAILAEAQQAGAERIVHCSSVAALGHNPDNVPADEATPVDPAGLISTYKRSKYQAEQAVLTLVRDESLPVVIVNPAAPVGPRDIKPTPTGKMIVDAANGRIPAYLDTGLKDRKRAV